MTMGLLSPFLMGSPQKLGGLLGDAPASGAFPAAPAAPMSSPSGGFGGGEPNWGLVALGQGIASGNVGGAFQQYAPLMAANQSKNKTRQWLVSKGMSPEDADVYASNPSLLSSVLNNKPEDDWMSAGDGILFNKRTQEFKQSPMSGTKAPTVQDFFDENGATVKKQWNPQTQQWEQMGGPKVTQATETQRNRLSQTDQAVSAINAGLDDYLAKVKAAGGVTMMPGPQKDQLKQSRTNVLLQLKELYNLGVLNGNDYQLMTGLLFDPTISVDENSSVLGTLGDAANKYLGGDPYKRTESSVNQMKQMMTQLQQSVHQTNPAARDNTTVPAPGGVVDYQDYFKGQ